LIEFDKSIYMLIEIGRRNMAEFGSYKKDERNKF